MNYYELYVGQIPVEEFIRPFSGDIDKAIESLVDEWPYDCEIPGDFHSVLSRYCLDSVEQED